MRMQLVGTALRGVVRRGMVVRSLATAESIEWTKEALRRADAVCFDFAGRPASLYLKREGSPSRAVVASRATIYDDFAARLVVGLDADQRGGHRRPRGALRRGRGSRGLDHQSDGRWCKVRGRHCS